MNVQCQDIGTLQRSSCTAFLFDDSNADSGRFQHQPVVVAIADSHHLFRSQPLYVLFLLNIQTLTMKNSYLAGASHQFNLCPAKGISRNHMDCHASGKPMEKIANAGKKTTVNRQGAGEVANQVFKFQ